MPRWRTSAISALPPTFPPPRIWPKGEVFHVVSGVSAKLTTVKKGKKNSGGSTAVRTGSFRRSAVSSVLTVLTIIVVAAVIVGAVVMYQQRNAYTSANPARPADSGVSVSGPNADAPIPDITKALQGPASNGALGQLAGQVTDASTGKTLWEKNSSTAMVPASSTKMMTTAAALLTLGPKDRVRTVVKRGTKPGQIVLVGGGDVTLAASKDNAFYTNAPTIQDLASQVKKNMDGQPVTSVVVDNSRAGQGDTFNSTWSRGDISGGNVTSVDSVMLNGGRQDPSDADSPRTDNPALVAGQALANAVGLSSSSSDGGDGADNGGESGNSGGGDDNSQGVSVSKKSVDTEDGELGAVESAPLDIRIHDMLVNSDNMEAEAIGREIAKKEGKPLTFEGATSATKEVLSQHGFPLESVVLKDNSGMSPDNRITPRLLDRIMVKASSPVTNEGNSDSSSADSQSHDLRPILDGLPVAGGNGTLAGRFTPGSSSGPGAGWVRAKTGTLDGVSALVGTVMNQQGRVLTFAFMSNGSDIEPARSALDDLASALRMSS